MSSAPAAGPLRPPWMGLSAAVLAGLLGIGLLWRLVELWGAGSKVEGSTLGGLGGVPVAPVLLLVGYGLAALCIWQYWKGENWARIALLLWAALALARALGVLADHSLDPAALMGRPLTFLQSVVAVILLYWLNTPPVRAWFKKVSSGPATLVSERLVGKLCTAVGFLPADPGARFAWRIAFEHGAELVLWCPWRIVLDGNLAFAYTPEADRASATIPSPAVGGAANPNSGELWHPSLESASMSDPEPNPVPDSPQEARRLLKNLRVTALRVAPRTSDLVVGFEMGIELQTWSLSAENASGPQWQYSDPAVTVIADERGINLRSAAQVSGAASKAPGE